MNPEKYACILLEIVDRDLFTVVVDVGHEKSMVSPRALALQ